jgi:hypothetical protein
MPLESTRLIHPDWSEHHYATVDGSLTALCTIWREGEGESVFDPETGETTPPDPIEIYSNNPCRIQQHRVADAAVAADDDILVTRYLVVVRADVAPIRAGQDEDWLIVDACEDDPQLVGKRMQIEEMTYGSLRWERDLTCSLDFSRGDS